MTINRPAQANYSQDIFYCKVSNFNLNREVLAPLFSLFILAKKI